jgi:group I intron endonuclease
MEKQIGVYFLRSTITGNIYIGSSSNLKRRKADHFRVLKKGAHINTKLNRHCKKFGVEDIIFKVKEYCSKEILKEREQHYIDKYKPYFNESNNVNGGGMLGRPQTEETKIQMGIIQHERYQNTESRSQFSKMMKISKNHPDGRLYENSKERGKVYRALQRIKKVEQALIDLPIKLERLKNDPILIKRNKAITDFNRRTDAKHHYMRGCV